MNARKPKWRTTERRAVTHRGVYVATLTQAQDYAYGYLASYDGGYQTVMAFAATLDEVTRACGEHAARQPAHPPMLGWPAVEP